jgi:hypothetical protein
MSEMLPSILKRTYSQHVRPRRSRSKLPEHLRNTIYRCIEYPEGVYIDHTGEPDPSQDVDVLLNQEFDELSDSEFEALPTPKRQKLIDRLKNRTIRLEKEEAENISDLLSGNIHDEYEANFVDLDDEYRKLTEHADAEFIESETESETEPESDSEAESEDSEAHSESETET